jgi:hypothetical protein
MTVCGRVRHVKSGKEKGFSVTMDHAKTLSLDATDLSTDRSSVPADLFEQTSPVGFWRLVVTGSGFADAGVPQIGSLRLEAICADKPTKATCNIPGNAVLVRGSVVFAPSAGKALEEELVAHVGTKYVKTGRGARSTFFGIDIRRDVDGHFE